MAVAFVSSVMSALTTQSNAETSIQKSFSCVLCAQRKVKCDRSPGGCANCTKARVPCMYKAPPPPRRRKKGERDIDTVARLRIYEEALRQLGIDPAELARQGPSTATSIPKHATGDNGFPSIRKDLLHKTHLPAEAGVLVTNEGRSRYLENGIWVSLQSEFREAREILEESSEDDVERIGLHRDPTKLGLPPFDVEMRRRLWWTIMMLEGFSQKLAGTGTTGTVLMGDVNMPSNVNDSDLFPGMKDAPKKHEGASEMMFFLIRCHVGEFLKRSSDTHTTFDGVWNRLTTREIQVAIKSKAIDELEAMFESKFLRYCDPSIPWHLMCSQLGKSIIFMMRFMAHSTQYYKTDMAQSEKDILFGLALQVIAAQNLVYTMKEMQGFMWHVNLHFQWKAFVYVLSELRYRSEGAGVDKAWAEVEKAHDFHPSFDKELSYRALPIAVSNLTLKAWDAYIARRGVSSTGEPYFIQASKNVPQLSTPDTTSSVTPSDMAGLNSSNVIPNTNSSQTFDWNAAMDFNGDMNMTASLAETVPLDYPETMNWATWDNLLVDFQTTASTEMPIDLSSFVSGNYYDLVITFDSNTYNVHKVIVCTRADFFARSVKFGGEVETSEGKIDLPHDDPDSYDPRLPLGSNRTNATSGDMAHLESIRTTLLCQKYGYAYTYDLPHTYLLLHSKMYTLGDKYDVIGIKDLATEKFKRACAAFWDNETFAAAAHHAFSTTMGDDKGLRDIVNATVSDHMELIRKPEVRTLMIEFGGLSLGILLKKADELGWGVKK
ncbi:hypothetical protein EK21DRAFT_105063 [Setomelanomma holmii]|uniref:Zn(2)-C6 fungal-type domain-containing protein n=1 Tax=Setomelanomma holmii TaxID=210430 RepID=A0A9P4LG44_9PLEO|nr:hypothetical protein EK21DRAFT_105063 [Setomelanomma holmii]